MRMLRQTRVIGHVWPFSFLQGFFFLSKSRIWLHFNQNTINRMITNEAWIWSPGKSANTFRNLQEKMNSIKDKINGFELRNNRLFLITKFKTLRLVISINPRGIPRICELPLVAALTILGCFLSAQINVTRKGSLSFSEAGIDFNLLGS